MTARIIFMGSPDFSVPCLTALAAAGFQIVCVYTQPPRPAGRGRQLRPTPVQAAAESAGLEVRSPRSLKGAAEQARFRDLEADLAVVVAYGLILPRPVLEAPRCGCLNLHASLLPRWRGAAPIQRALMAGDAETGVEAMIMEEGLDTGPVLLSRRTPILPEDTAQSLHDRLSAIGAGMIVEAVEARLTGAVAPRPQAEEGIVYAAKISPAETRIDWALPAVEVDRRIRGLSPFPGAWFEAPGAGGPIRVKALRSRAEAGGGPPGVALDDRLLIACGEGAVRLLEVQREGRQPAAAEAFLRGFPAPAGLRLG